MSPYTESVTVIRMIIMTTTDTNYFNAYSCPNSATINMIFRFTILTEEFYCRL